MGGNKKGVGTSHGGQRGPIWRVHFPTGSLFWAKITWQWWVFNSLPHHAQTSLILFWRKIQDSVFSPRRQKVARFFNPGSAIPNIRWSWPCKICDLPTINLTPDCFPQASFTIPTNTFKIMAFALRNIGGGYFRTRRYPSFSHILPTGFLGCWGFGVFHQDIHISLETHNL